MLKFTQFPQSTPTLSKGSLPQL